MVATCPVSAAIFTPANTAALVAAINAANTNGQSDTIDLGWSTFTLAAVDNAVDGDNGLPDILADGGHTVTVRNGTIERSTAAPAFRLLHVSAGATLAVESVALRNGDGQGGGAIFNLGALSVASSTLSGNFSGIEGGAVFNDGTLSVADSTFSGNATISAGGAISNWGSLSVADSTFSDNFAEFLGGAIVNSSPGSTFRNCTFSGNIASLGGGAILNGSIISSITNTTITLNTVRDEGGGILNEGPGQILELVSSIVAANTGNPPDLLNRGTLASASNNLIGIGDGSGLTNGVNGNQVGSLASPLNPLLGPLADNGGPTFTHALLAGSPAIDAGSNPAALVNDQRGPGFSRVSGAGTDVGAFEVQSADLSVTNADTPDPVIAGASVTYTVSVANAGPDAAATVLLSDPLPAGTTFVSLGAPGGWSCSTPAVGAGGTVSCSTASFPVSSATFTVVAAVGGATPLGTVLSNTATVTSATPDPDSVDTSATATTTVVSPAALSATKTVSGYFGSGGRITYTIVVRNAGPGAQLDNPGNELVDVLPAELALVSTASTTGTAVATTGTNTVTWNGSILAGGTVTITVQATVRAEAPRGASVSNQATIAYDLDGNGTNEASGVSDDPATTAAGDPTVFTASGEAMVPVLGRPGIGLLALLVALGGAFAAGRRLS